MVLLFFLSNKKSEDCAMPMPENKIKMMNKIIFKY